MEHIVKDDEFFFAKLRETAKIPTKKLEDAGFDTYADFEEDFFVIKPGETRPIPTGIATAFSPKYYVQVEERSGMAKNGIKKSGGVIDSGYRGEYFILTYNTNKKPFIISKIAEADLDDEFVVDGETYEKDECIIYPYTKAICQLVVQEVPALEVKEVSYQDLLHFESERGDGRFGHSGK